jgi:DNA ligase-associated metallophosphoesterase
MKLIVWPGISIFYTVLRILQTLLFLCQMSVVNFMLMGVEVQLLPDRALYFPSLGVLVLSDLHLGKINHFRKSGIAVPLAANDANLEALVKLVLLHKPKRVIFIGDLFHSHYNSAWESLGPIIRNFSSCSFELVRGNHDIMSALQYERHGIIVQPIEYELTSKIFLIHEPMETAVVDKYFISGHIHPAVHLSGRGRQSVTLPCFWFGKYQAVLPAFGVFTGMMVIRPEPGDNVFAIVKDELLDVSLPAVQNNANGKF